MIFSLALGVVSAWQASAADSSDVSFTLGCGGFSSGGEILLNRDNTGSRQETFSMSANDGAGNVIFAGQPDSFFVGGTVSWADGGTFGWTRAPQFNPLTLRVVSLAGNGLPAEVVHVTVGSCPDLPTISVASEFGQGGGFPVVLDPRLLEGETSAAVPLNTAPPRPENPLGLAEALPGYAIVNTDNLSVRSGDGPEYTLVAIVDGGTQLVVLGRNGVGGDAETWWYVQVGDVVGWVNGQFLYFRGDLSQVPEVPVRGDLIQPRFLLIREEAPLYATPSFVASGICTLQGGLEYQVVGRDQNIVWYEIVADCNGATVTGWIPAYLGAIRNPAALFIPVTI
jgi:uncharacterized protein YgiM (DUF1202 family)